MRFKIIDKNHFEPININHNIKLIDETKLGTKYPSVEKKIFMEELEKEHNDEKLARKRRDERKFLEGMYNDGLYNYDNNDVGGSAYLDGYVGPKQESLLPSDDPWYVDTDKKNRKKLVIQPDNVIAKLSKSERRKYRNDLVDQILKDKYLNRVFTLDANSNLTGEFGVLPKFKFVSYDKSNYTTSGSKNMIDLTSYAKQDETKPKVNNPKEPELPNLQSDYETTKDPDIIKLKEKPQAKEPVKPSKINKLSLEANTKMLKVGKAIESATNIMNNYFDKVKDLQVSKENKKLIDNINNSIDLLGDVLGGNLEDHVSKINDNTLKFKVKVILSNIKKIVIGINDGSITTVDDAINALPKFTLKKAR